MSVRIEKNGAVWTVIHDRPEARNAMDPRSADDLTAAFLEFDARLGLTRVGDPANQRGAISEPAQRIQAGSCIHCGDAGKEAARGLRVDQ